MSVPLLHRKCNRFDYVYRIILQAHRYEAFLFTFAVTVNRKREIN
jgi:hypothetical protein